MPKIDVLEGRFGYLRWQGFPILLEIFCLSGYRRSLWESSLGKQDSISARRLDKSLQDSKWHDKIKRFTLDFVPRQLPKFIILQGHPKQTGSFQIDGIFKTILDFT